MSVLPKVPYVVGQWVRGEKFYGRSALIEEVLQGNRNCLWLLGTRRIGKTSLLKQLEHVTLHAPERRYFPVFWDFQGADSAEELHLGFNDALLDAEEQLEQIGISVEDVEAQDLFSSLARLRRRLRPSGLKLLLLCDEVEELIGLNRSEPSLLRKLRRALQSPDDIRSVLASSIRLWALAEQKEDTSPFLHGFTPPLYIRHLTDDEARALIRQANLPSESRPRFDEAAVELVRTRCDNHPYLMQLVCKRRLELGDLDEAIEQVVADRMVSYFFSVDFEMLSPTERNIIRIVRECSSSTSNSIQERLALDAGALSGHLTRLKNLGHIRRDAERRFVLVNYFFRRWLDEMPDARQLSDATAGGPPQRSAATDSTVVSVDDGTEVIDDRYELLQQVGRGATGVVFKAHDRLLDVTIAIKLLKHEFASHRESLERFRQEIVLSRDIGHPNILRTYHLGEFAGQKYLTMSWVEGATLAERLKQEGPLPPRTTLRLATKLASALEAAHGRNVLHRDIKPQNILIDREGEPYLSDFGLARLLGEPGITQGGMFVGTPDYSSPEQARLQPVDERSDIYALGIVLFEMATGRKPFLAASIPEVLEQHRSAQPPDPRQLHAAVPAGLSKVILRCVEKDPTRRFSSAAELRLALESATREFEALQS